MADLRVLICRSNPIAPDPRVMKEAQTLVEAGYQVKILGWDRTAELPVRAIEGAIQLHRLPIRAEFASGIGNLPALLRWQVGLLVWLLRHRDEFDLVHACDFDTVLPAQVWKRLVDGRLIYDIFDFYADHLRNTPAWIKRMIRRIDLWAVEQADAVILVDDSRKAQIATTRPRRCAVIYNSPQDAPSVPESFGDRQTDGLHISYVGLLQVERGIMELLEVVKRQPGWTLSLAGYGGDQDIILRTVEGMPNVEWHGRIPYDQSLKLNAAADVLIATYDPIIPNHRFSSPNKIFEAMMLGKPIIVAENTNTDRIINESRSGLVVPYGDPDALENALMRLQQEPVLRAQLGENGRQAYEETYGWEIMAQRLVNLYRDVLGDASSQHVQ